MKKVYTIKITSNNSHPNIWYAKRIGQEFEAELSMGAKGYVVYRLKGNYIVHPEDCIVLNVKEEEKHFKEQRVE